MSERCTELTCPHHGEENRRKRGEASKRLTTYLMLGAALEGTCWCDGPDCGQTPCIEDVGTTRPTDGDEAREVGGRG